MDLSTVTVQDFKARFYRDFQYAEVNNASVDAVPNPNFVQTIDIETAFIEAQAAMNPGLLPDDATIKAAYLLLSAHFMVQNINMANAGMGSTAAMPVSARSVGNVSESYTIPDAYTKDPLLATYTSTSYGLKYLAMVMPFLVGNMRAVCGGTNP